MQTRIASSLMVCGLGLFLAGAAVAQTTIDNGSTSTSTDPSTTPTNMHWTRPSDADLAKYPDRLVPIPPRALRAEMRFDTTNAVKVWVRGRDRHMDPEKKRHDWEKTLYLAPGVRIFGADNMLKMSGSLKGHYRTKFLLEPGTGLLMQIWILTPKEIWTEDRPMWKPGDSTTSNPTTTPANVDD